MLKRIATTRRPLPVRRRSCSSSRVSGSGVSHMPWIALSGTSRCRTSSPSESQGDNTAFSRKAVRIDAIVPADRSQRARHTPVACVHRYQHSTLLIAPEWLDRSKAGPTSPARLDILSASPGRVVESSHCLGLIRRRDAHRCSAAGDAPLLDQGVSRSAGRLEEAACDASRGEYEVKARQGRFAQVSPLAVRNRSRWIHSTGDAED